MSGDALAWRWRLALLLTVLSGFAGLGYQIVWTQQCALWLGHEAPAVLAVITAFFSGLSLGALLLAQRIERSRRPSLWYAASEAAVAAWALLAGLLMHRYSTELLSLTGTAPSALRQWGLSFAGILILLLPATTAMGASLPAMQRAWEQLRPGTLTVAALYSANTAGAVAGVLIVCFWCIPHLGLAHSLWICAALSLCCAAGWLLAAGRSPASAPLPSSLPSPRALRLPWRLAATGLLGIGFEVLVVRVLSEVAEDTVYTYALLLAVYLVGSAAGAAAFRRMAFASRQPDAVADYLLLAMAAASLLGTAFLWFVPACKALLTGVLGERMSSALLVEASLALLAFAPATFVMGALFSHLAQQAVRKGVPFGLALGINTLGCAAAPGVFGVVALPLLGPKLALLAVAFAYLLLGSRRLWSMRPAWLAVAVTGLLAALAPPLAFVDLPDGGRILHYEDGMMAAVSVVEDAEGVSRLRIDNRQQEGSSGTRRVDSRQAFLPLLLHTAPRHALFLGLGTGVTSFAATQDPELSVDVAELLPEVIRASHYFVESSPELSPRLRLINADARRYVRTSERRYDVIVADNFHPARSGAGSLYTVEHFEAIRQRLQPGGVFCQWLPLHQLDLTTLRSILRSFLAVYPQGWAMLASNSLETPVIGLVARGDGGRFDEAALRARLASAAGPLRLDEVGIEDEFALFGSFIAGPDSLKELAGNAELNTDDRPIVAYRAPRITYEPDSLPRDRLIDLLHRVSIRPGDLLNIAATGDSADRLSAYWSARNQFIEAGRNVRGGSDAATLLAQVREPLLAVLDISPDFRPAYEPLFRLALGIAPDDASASRQLLGELIRRQPLRPEAAMALQQLGNGS